MRMSNRSWRWGDETKTLKEVSRIATSVVCYGENLFLCRIRMTFCSIIKFPTGFGIRNTIRRVSRCRLKCESDVMPMHNLPTAT